MSASPLSAAATTVWPSDFSHREKSWRIDDSSSAITMRSERATGDQLSRYGQPARLDSIGKGQKCPVCQTTPERHKPTRAALVLIMNSRGGGARRRAVETQPLAFTGTNMVGHPRPWIGLTQ